MTGFVYLLGNRAMPTYYKVGMSELDPHERAAQLSKPTGIPEPFDVVCHIRTDLPLQVEQHLHEILTDYRHSFSREFFRLASVQMPWLVGLLRFYPTSQEFFLCSGWRLHHYLNEDPIQNPWEGVEAGGAPAMSDYPPDMVYMREAQA